MSKEPRAIGRTRAFGPVITYEPTIELSRHRHVASSQPYKGLRSCPSTEVANDYCSRHWDHIGIARPARRVLFILYELHGS